MRRWEGGTIENEGQPNEHIVVIGYYIYYDPDGKKQMVQYSGDENGFHILPEVSIHSPATSTYKVYVKRKSRT